MTGPVRISEIEMYNAPVAPENIKVSYTGGSEATISWDTTVNDYFIIYDGGKVLADHVTLNSYKFTNLEPGSVYKLSVRTAYTDPYSYKLMISPGSSVVELKTDGKTVVPNAPTSITVKAASDKSIDVTWDAVSDAQSYRVALVTDACERIVADEYKGTAYTIKDLTPGTTYMVKVYSLRRTTPSASAAVGMAATTGTKSTSDNLLFNKEVQYSSVWANNPSADGGQKALDNDLADGSRWVTYKGSATGWLMVDIGEVTPVNVLEYYSLQNKLMKVSFYYATDGAAFADPNSDKWIKIITDDRVAQGKYGSKSIVKIAESIKLATPVNARFIKFTVDSADGDIFVNEIKAFYTIGKFNDVANYGWARKSIETLASQGVINGTSEKTFDPGAEITRADYTMLLVKTLGLTAKVETNFADVNPSDYYYKELGVAKALGIAQGQGDNKFHPDEKISRQDMMVLAAKAMTYAKKLKAVGSQADLKSFTDNGKISDYAAESIATLVKEGLIQGSGSTMSPLGNATRAEVAVLMYRIYNK